jgi:hypothetical protein
MIKWDSHQQSKHTSKNIHDKVFEVQFIFFVYRNFEKYYGISKMHQITSSNAPQNISIAKNVFGYNGQMNVT